MACSQHSIACHPTFPRPPTLHDAGVQAFHRCRLSSHSSQMSPLLQKWSSAPATAVYWRVRTHHACCMMQLSQLFGMRARSAGKQCSAHFPGREEVQWGRELQQRCFLTDIPMQIRAVLLGFRGLTNNEGLNERAEDAYTDQFQAAQSVGQSTSTSLIVLQLAVSFFYLRALPGCQVRLVKEQAGTASVSGPGCSSDSVLVADLAAGAAIHLWRANPRRGQCSALCQFHCATGAVPGRPPDSCCGARTEGLVTFASILTAAGRHNKSYHFSSAVQFKLAYCDCGYTNVHRRRAFVRVSCQGEATF
ncbi:hypothetical protein DUNSADRAFT_12896 [Dunaliella salina]|uniref:Encoded protein n=1 Tax=Dunaliella salina TaxID=3046 RepID=A0ABQ7H3L3_DUNSA|nr:hypothetical protein DUNSADRAFT_12896 [Dunaliella salina]KAF5841452.1 hypothetical protein DUNSADRAFT_12896 [Dunaliella salina]|eukprot:KAF5841451.1 hypothetical protein DUNSADRAFT_12896 [Dunaliella salina]